MKLNSSTIASNSAFVQIRVTTKTFQITAELKITTYNILNSQDSSDLHSLVFNSQHKEKKRHIVSMVLLYKQSQLAWRMVPAFDSVPRGCEYTSPVMLQTNRQEFFILAVSVLACCFLSYLTTVCYFRERACGTDRQWIAWVGVLEWWAGDGSVSVCVCS